MDKWKIISSLSFRVENSDGKLYKNFYRKIIDYSYTLLKTFIMSKA